MCGAKYWDGSWQYGLSLLNSYWLGIRCPAEGLEPSHKRVLTNIIPEVYTIGMNKYAVINLKTDPELKKLVAKTADKLGVSVSAVLNNELRRFATEQSVTFDLPEVPNAKTAKELAESRKQIEAGNYYKFDNNSEALDFLAGKLKLK